MNTIRPVQEPSLEHLKERSNIEQRKMSTGVISTKTMCQLLWHVIHQPPPHPNHMRHMFILQTKMIFPENLYSRKIMHKRNLPGLSSSLTDSTLLSSSKKQNSTDLKHFLVFLKLEDEIKYSFHSIYICAPAIQQQAFSYCQ